MIKANLLSLFTVVILASLAAGCASAPKKMDAVVFTEQALAATDVAKVGRLEKGSEAERKAIEQFKTFNSDFSTNNIITNTKLTYTQDLYFRDPFKEMHSEPEFEAYLLRGASAVSEFSMEWLDVSEHDGNYYFRWIMSVKLHRDDKDKPAGRTTGISHVRFGKDGKVIFHQDYFDGASFIYEKIPILGAEIRFIKKRM
jgi:outer membrane murein-binding lipoprotein Lpp